MSTLYDQTLSKFNAVQTTNSQKPTLCTDSERIYKRYYLKFNVSQTMTTDIISKSMYRKARYCECFYCIPVEQFSTSYWCVNSILGNDDHGNDGFFSFISPGDLVVAYGGDYFTLGPTQSGYNTKHKDFYKTKSDCGILNTWV